MTRPSRAESLFIIIFFFIKFVMGVKINMGEEKLLRYQEAAALFSLHALRHYA